MLQPPSPLPKGEEENASFGRDTHANYAIFLAFQKLYICNIYVVTAPPHPTPSKWAKEKIKMQTLAEIPKQEITIFTIYDVTAPPDLRLKGDEED